MASDPRSGRNRRQQPRVACTPTSAVLAVEGLSKLVPVRVLNVSGTGMGLSLNVPVDSGTKVRITLPQTVVQGEICFCHSSDEDTYEAGLLITEVIRIPAAPPASLEPARESRNF